MKEILLFYLFGNLNIHVEQELVAGFDLQFPFTTIVLTLGNSHPFIAVT